MRRIIKVQPKLVTWLGEEVFPEQRLSNSFRYYQKFQYQNITAEIGEFVLISNADAAEPDTEEGCDAARILSLYEDSSNSKDPFRAKVQWYSRPENVPDSCFNGCEPIDFLENEVLEDNRPFDTDVSIETFFKKCNISLTFTKDTALNPTQPYNYICRWRLTTVTKRKVQVEPVLEQERQALELLRTPAKSKTTTPKTPNSLVKRMGRVSISEKNWSVSKNDGTKLLLKRAILADKIEKDSPKKCTLKIAVTPKKTATPKSKNLTNDNIEEMLSMELRENSDEELPTLIIRKHIPTTPKRKSSIPRSNDVTPQKILLFDDDVTETPTRSTRNRNRNINYTEPELSPVKRTPRKPYTEPEELPVKRTPRKSIRKMSLDASDEEFEIKKPAPKTPKTPRTPRGIKTPRVTPGKTPKRKIISELTPTLHSRVHSVDNANEFIKDKSSLPGREEHLEEILSFVRNKLLDGTSGCMYISGVPGTGKTATVGAALAALKEEADNGLVPDFQLVQVNGMRLAEPRQAYVEIYKQLTGKSVVWEQACSLLEKRFTAVGPRRSPAVLLVDELDALCTRRQDVLYSIMEWAAHSSAKLSVLAVANTMDLPERALAARVASRLGLTRRPFAPYTHEQLRRIVEARLVGDLEPDAVQLIARKVAAVSGDARRALALCTRALEISKMPSNTGTPNKPGTLGAGLLAVQKALSEAAGGAAVRAVRACSQAERLMLRAVAAEVERTGSDETTLSRVLSTASAIVALDGRPYKSAPSIRAPTWTQARTACARLAALRLVLLEPKDPEPRLLLNVSADDVHYATRQIVV